jgi:hypothetical protein
VEPVANRPKKEKKKKKPRGDPTVTSSVERFGRRVKNDKLPEDASSAPRNLYVKNLPRDFNAKKLAHLFMPHGDVQSTKFVLDAGPVPTGLVRFATAEEAAAATAALHGATLSADDADFSASDSGSSESSDVDSDSHTGLTTQTETVRLEISLAMTRAERDAARVARAEEREKRKQRRAERAERVKRLATSRTSGDKSLAKDGFAVRVTHVPVGLDHKQLRSIFVAFGKLGRVKMMWPNGEVPSAVVTFRDEAAANAAAASLAGEYLPGCKGPMAFEAHKSARGTRKKTRTKERGVKKKSEEEEGEQDSESSSDSEDSEDSSSSESERESASPSSELSPNENSNGEEGEEVAPLFVLRPESVTITDKITARADAARAAAGRVWRDVQASRAVSSPEALEKAKALNAAATARAKALRDEKRERGEPLANVGSDSNSAVAPADLLRRRREARGVFADPNAAQTESRARRGLNPRAEGASRRVRAYAERRRDGADLSPRARVGHALVAGPGVDANTALSEEARAKLAAAAARKRARGRGVGFADSMAEMRGFGGRGGSGSRRGASRGGPGGGGGGGSDARSARNSRRGRDGDSLDEKTRAALAARVEEARRASASESPWEWDVATFESGARKTFLENFNVAEYASAPVVPGFGVESNVSALRSAYTASDEESFLDSQKAFIQQQGGITSDAQFESVKRDALASFARYKSLYEKQRETRGESPIEGDFLAERQTLLDAVEGVSETNPLRSFATRAADALDGNAGWSYARKVAALRFLASKAERYEHAESAE